MDSPNIFAVAKSGQETWLNVRPATLVFVFLLSPHQFGVLVEISLFLDQIEGEGRDLKNTIITICK